MSSPTAACASTRSDSPASSCWRDDGGRIIFGPDDAEPLLGVVMLESLGFTVDPVTQTLKRLPLLPLKPLAA